MSPDLTPTTRPAGWLADQCAGSEQAVGRDQGRHQPCPVCGRRITVGPSGKVHAHKPGHYDPKDWEPEDPKLAAQRERWDWMQTLSEGLEGALDDPALDATTRRMAQRLYDRLDAEWPRLYGGHDLST